MSTDPNSENERRQAQYQISVRKNALDRERQKKMKDLMAEYDTTVFYPARKALVQECFKLGHHPTHHHSNGLGWSWFYCGYCGGRTKITGPEDETSLDDGAPEPDQPEGE